jgi:hypothetical protein
MNVIERQEKRREINGSDLSRAAHNGLVAGSSPATSHSEMPAN